MDNINNNDILEKIKQIKEQENSLSNERHLLESELLKNLNHDITRSGTYVIGKNKLKVTVSNTTKINQQNLVDIIMQHKLKDIAAEVFKWEAKIDNKKMALLSKDIKELFNPAFETKYNKPVITITTENNEAF